MKGQQSAAPSHRTEIIACTCAHEAQDAIHGPRLRVHNWAAKVGPRGSWRCTVCGATKPL